MSSEERNDIKKEADDVKSEKYVRQSGTKENVNIRRSEETEERRKDDRFELKFERYERPSRSFGNRNENDEGNSIQQSNGYKTRDEEEVVYEKYSKTSRTRDYNERRGKIKLSNSEKNKLSVKRKMSVEEMQEDPFNPLCAKYTSFDELFEKLGIKNDGLLRGLHEMSFSKPSSIQEKSLPIILNTDKNLIAQAQSGTGKTACFSIGIFNTINPSIKQPQVIVISPTLELAAQTFDVLLQIGKYKKDITVLETTKGIRFPRVITHHIVCGTPGKIIGLLRRKTIRADKIKLLVIDEADALLEHTTNSLRDQAFAIRKMLNRSTRIFLFSATFRRERDESKRNTYQSREDEEKESRLKNFAYEYVPQPRSEILVPRERLTLESMNQYWIKTETFQEKAEVISDIYSELTIGQSIIFVNRKDVADQLNYVMTKEGHEVSVLHSEIELRERKARLLRFRQKKSKVLICTDVLSRGVDIRTVTLVVNFDIPWHPAKRNEPEYSTYIHRIGRTARFGGYGVAITFVESRNYFMIEKLEKFYNTKIKELKSQEIENIEY